MATDQEIRAALVDVQDAEIQAIIGYLSERVRIRTQDTGETFSNFTQRVTHGAFNDLRIALGLEPKALDNIQPPAEPKRNIHEWR